MRTRMHPFVLIPLACAIGSSIAGCTRDDPTTTALAAIGDAALGTGDGARSDPSGGDATAVGPSDRDASAGEEGPCRELGVLAADGTNCTSTEGPPSVCHAGVCTPCFANMPCAPTSPPLPCHVYTTSCAGGVGECIDRGPGFCPACGIERAACGDVCCDAGLRCANPTTGECAPCAAGQLACGGSCCAAGQTCDNPLLGICSGCDPGAVGCGPTCCEDNRACLDPATGACSTCLVGVTDCSGN